MCFFNLVPVTNVCFIFNITNINYLDSIRWMKFIIKIAKISVNEFLQTKCVTINAFFS